MTTTRILPPAEWARLLETGCNLFQAHQTAMLGGHVIVEENAQGEIVGTAFAMVSVHLDGLWVREDCRHGSTFRRLGRALMRMARQANVSHVFAHVKNQHLEEWLVAHLQAEREETLRIPVVTHV
jgi:N-acetylglutamate synthase-like GNAT family acetyltransferase